MQSIFNKVRLSELLNSLKLELFDPSKIGFLEYEMWGTCYEIGVAVRRKKQTFMKRTFLTPVSRMVMATRRKQEFCQQCRKPVVQTFREIVSKTFVILACRYFSRQFSVLQFSWCCSITNNKTQTSGTECLIFVCDGTRKSFVKKKN